MSISFEEAEKIAQETLRFDIGNRPWLGESIFDKQNERYVFPIHYTPIKLSQIQGVGPSFYESKCIGVILVSTKGEIFRTSNERISDEISLLNEKRDEGKLERLSDIKDYSNQSIYQVGDIVESNNHVFELFDLNQENGTTWYCRTCDELHHPEKHP